MQHHDTDAEARTMLANAGGHWRCSSPRARHCSLAIALLLASPLACAAAAANAKPNIVFVMADDLGWGEPGAFPAGSAHGRIDTPHLDRLAAEGMRFTNAYAGYTVCAPSRTTLFTGRHSGKFDAHGLPGTSLAPGQAAVSYTHLTLPTKA